MYGDGSGVSDRPRLEIGNLVVRGERDVLLLSRENLMRIRHNPFFFYVQRRIEEILDADESVASDGR